MSLTKAEREIVLTIADDESSWHVFADSRRALSTRLRKVAAAWGVTPQRLGEGWEFDLPLRAIRLGAPRVPRVLSEEAKATARARFTEAKSRRVRRLQSEGTGGRT